MSSEAILKLLIALNAAVYIGFTIWMFAAPHSFYDNIGPFDPYSEHFTRDAGAFQGGIGIALAASIWVERLRAGAIAALLAATVLHLVNHLIDFNGANGDTAIDSVEAVALALAALVSVWMLREALRERPV